MEKLMKNPESVRRTRHSQRQRDYLRGRKTDKPRLIKHEEQLQNEFCAWFLACFPGEHFISDTGSGAFNSEYAKFKHGKQQSHKHEPDVKILAARRGYHGLLIELKRDGFALRMKRDGRNLRIYKDSRGRITDRDYKIRKKGDWASLHLERQAAVLLDYETNRGYCARFAVGLAHAQKLVCWYFDVAYHESQTLF